MLRRVWRTHQAAQMVHRPHNAKNFGLRHDPCQSCWVSSQGIVFWGCLQHEMAHLRSYGAGRSHPCASVLTLSHDSHVASADSAVKECFTTLPLTQPEAEVGIA